MCSALVCKLICSSTYSASVWLSGNLHPMSRQMTADRWSLAFSAFPQTDAPLSHLFFLFFTSCFQEFFEQLTEYLIIRQL